MRRLCSRYWVAVLVLYFAFLALAGAGTVGLGAWAVSHMPAPYRWYMSGEWEQIDPGFRYDPGSGFDDGFGYDDPYGYYGYDDGFPYDYYGYYDSFPYDYYGYGEDFFPYGYDDSDDDPYSRYYNYNYGVDFPEGIDGFSGADCTICPESFSKARLLDAGGRCAEDTASRIPAAIGNYTIKAALFPYGFGNSDEVLRGPRFPRLFHCHFRGNSIQ